MSNSTKSSTALPELAILIPVFNPGDKLRRSLDALVTMECGTVIIVNDGGKEDLSYVTEYPGLRATLIDLPENAGITKALNIGLQHCLDAGYAYIARLDAGDIPISNRFAKQARFLDEHPDHAMVGCQVEIRNLDGEFEFFFTNPTSSTELKKAMYTRNAFFHCSVMFRAEVVRKLGGYDETFPVAQDYEFFFRICTHYPTGLIDEVLVHDLYNPKGISYSRRAEQLRAKLRVQLRYFSPLEIRSYAGVIKSLVIILLPDTLTWHVKRIVKNTLSSRTPGA